MSFLAWTYCLKQMQSKNKGAKRHNTDRVSKDVLPLGFVVGANTTRFIKSCDLNDSLGLCVKHLSCEDH